MNAYGEPDSQPEYRPRGPQGPNPYLAPAREAFWLDESERLTYEHAVEVNPRGKDEGAITYLTRIAALAAGRLAPAAKPMPAAILEAATSADVTPHPGQERQVAEKEREAMGALDRRVAELQAQRLDQHPDHPLDTDVPF